ncbi:uncharacterized protein LOC130894277 [Diorhabda carinulata]|uniref:uncharacterized protein LOC130446356 n=1 Tax=Diorhabda sublineata TaxID=1163346 RepID=UPI0024E0941F|nr:uncharacterized protein LOC130446356 [Diorhabda sublineata]XP_057656974.1 uncharacterized protein LOC130894277 [Diorhabda carinulata]
MGSTAKAIVTGFICRLCSEQKKVVIHLYSERARKLDLLKKIRLLPISLKKYDNLPKTICEECVIRLEEQYKLFKKIKRSQAIHRSHQMYHSNGRCPVECPLHGLADPSWSEITLDEATNS